MGLDIESFKICFIKYQLETELLATCHMSTVYGTLSTTRTDVVDVHDGSEWWS